jgi:hypothetical protein
MSITFNCERCHKEVKAPDNAAGKRGKCPFCGESTYVPMPVSEDELLPLAPIDEEEERRRKLETQALLKQAKELLSESGEGTSVPLDQKEDISSEDLHHFVVNFCIDMADGKLDRAQTQVPQLKKHGQTGLQAIDDFASGRVLEAALDRIPGRVLQGLLADLRDRVRG